MANLFSKCTCINMKRASRAITGYYDRALASAGVTVNQFSLLVTLQRMGSGSTSGLAVRLHLDRSTMVRNLKPLIAAGYIEDTAREGARDRRLQLTQKGLSAINAAAPLWEKAQDEVRSRIGAEDFDTFLRVLNEIKLL